MAIVLDPWKVPVAISFPQKATIVIASFNGPSGAGISGGFGLASASPYHTGKQLKSNGTLGVVASLTIGPEPSPASFDDLSKIFLKEFDTGIGAYVSYADRLAQLEAQFSPVSVIKRGIDKVDRGNGEFIYFQEYVMLGFGTPNYIDIFRSAVAFELDGNSQALLNFDVGRKSPSDEDVSYHVDIVAYDKKPELTANTDGTITVDASHSGDGGPAPRQKWTFSVTQPIGTTIPPPENRITYKITATGVTT